MYDTEYVEVTEQRPVVTNPRCDRCGEPLQFVFEDEPSRHFRDALTVDLSGGWACYIDETSSSHDLCCVCARDLYRWLGVPDPNDPANWGEPL